MLNRLEAAAARRRLARRGVDAGARPQLAMAAGSDCLPQIEHIVILMMENHSYDNYLGMLAGRGDGLPLDDHGLPTPANLAGGGTAVRMRHFTGTPQRPGVPTQSWNASHIQWDGAPAPGSCAASSKPCPARTARWP